MLLNETSKKLFGKKLLLLIHHHADVDAVASAIALQTVFKEAIICAPDGVSSHGQKVAEANETEIILESPEEWEGTVIALDSPNPEHCSPVPKTKHMMVIDHHTKIEGWPSGTEIIHQPNKTSTAEIIIQIIKELGFEINKKCANVLLAAIYTDTGQFRHANNETFGSASILCENGAEPQKVINLLDSERPLIQKVTFLKAAQNMKWIQHGKWIIATSIVGSFESGSARHLIILGADIALVGSSNKKGEMRLSTRASNRIVAQGFNLTKILEKICEVNEGSSGGHPGAAGYNGVGDTEAIIEIAKQESINTIRDMS